jgi:hypothetical protein
MLAVHLENGAVTLRKMAKHRLPEQFALIRLLYGGICNTDLELRRGYYGFRGTPGHEFVGEVVEAGDRELVWQACGGRDQPRMWRVRMVRPRSRAALPDSDSARNRETPRRVS